MNRGSLRLRLFLAGAVSVAAALGISALGLSLLFERHAERRVVTELGVFLDRLVAGVERSPDGTLITADAPADPRFAQPLSGLYWQVQSGATVLRSRSLWDTQLDASAELTNGAVHQFHLAGPGGSDLIGVERLVTLPPRLGGDRIRAVVALDSSEIAAARSAFTADLLPYLLLIGFLLMIAAYAQVAVGLRPLAAVRQRLAAIRQGVGHRLGAAFPDEILPLAAEVDALLDAREQEVEKARSRAADLAHGLKTPLQVLSGDVRRLRERGEEGLAKDIEQVAATMRRHVDRELVRARMAAGGSNMHSSVAEVVSRVVAVVSRTPAGARIFCSIDIPDDLAVRIDTDDLAEALGNLIENATRHARAKVSISADRQDERVVIRVIDDGPGIPEDRLEQALVRGARLDQLGEGAGLGLAIVRDIADAWSGQFDIRNGSVGLVAALTLPCATSAPSQPSAR